MTGCFVIVKVKKKKDQRFNKTLYFYYHYSITAHSLHSGLIDSKRVLNGALPNPLLWKLVCRCSIDHSEVGCSLPSTLGGEVPY